VPAPNKRLKLPARVDWGMNLSSPAPLFAAALASLPFVGVSAAQTLACHVRGSQQWLATRPSPLDSSVLTVKGMTAKICYSRPSARGRSLDSLVPPGRAWRVGANEPTTITLTDSMEVGNVRLAAGRYLLLAVPGAPRWTVAFYSTPDTEPIAMFRSMKQVALGSGEVQTSAEFVEQFRIRNEADSGSAGFVLEWGTWRVRIPVRAAL